jgi:hypothetical protein
MIMFSMKIINLSLLEITSLAIANALSSTNIYLRCTSFAIDRALALSMSNFLFCKSMKFSICFSFAWPFLSYIISYLAIIHTNVSWKWSDEASHFKSFCLLCALLDDLHGWLC